MARNAGVRRAPPDGGSIEEFYAAHAGALVDQLLAYTGDLATAQDVVQEAFCRALTRWDRISRYDDPVAWVRKVAWNLATSRWRRVRTAVAFARRHREVTVPGPEPDRVALVAALAKVPEKHRRVLVLYYLADLTTRDIARQEGVPEGTIRVWLRRGRIALVAAMGAEDDCA